jgi:hypothetical protein
VTAVKTLRGRRAWWATIAATGLSAYALDLVATAAGLAMVASGLLAGVGHGWLLTWLAASYAAWGLGLRANLRANADLLAHTGMSTNVLSKAAYDLTRRRTTNPRIQRWAAATGYVGTELAKEAPYYAGAFGLAAVADPVTSDQALIFLAGTNLGAMLYEYGLARLTRRYLRRS